LVKKALTPDETISAYAVYANLRITNMNNTTATTVTVRFNNADKKVAVLLNTLIEKSVEFLALYQNSAFASRTFWENLGSGDGEILFSNLLKASGFDNDPNGFFTAVFEIIAKGEGRKVVVNDMVLPHALSVHLLEQVIPGNGYISVKKTDQLVKAANLAVPKSDAGNLQKVMDTYPVRLSRHTIRQLMVSKDVGYQYLPFVEELDKVGHTNTWIGQFHDGLLEQMYENRVIFLLNMSCPVYCRFCFRKHKDSRNEANPTVEDVQKAVQHVKDSPSVKEIVVTGGDPFMSRPNMAATIDGLMQVDHVQTVRLATRSVAYYPDLFLDNEGAYLKYLKQKSLELQQHGKRLELATHFIHPDEVSPESLEIISELVNSGIAVYIQTPFLSECNDQGPELVKLFSMLRGAGAELHYIYIPCSPIHGNSIYWKSLSHGIDMALHLRAHLSDRVIPRICTATPIGKMDWFTSGWAVEKVEGNDNFIWIRTPYTPEYFRSFAPLEKKFDNMRLNKEGTIDIQYMARIGNEDYLIGSRPRRSAPKNTPASTGEIDQLMQDLTRVKQTAGSIVNTGIDTVLRVHETRVEIEPEAGAAELSYIEQDPRITDVVISSAKDAVDSLFRIRQLISALETIPHVNAVRLVSKKFVTAPEDYTRAVINTLGDLNRLRVINPLRLEIETWLMTKEQLTPAHEKLARRLNNKGITVYCNVPLLGGVNDSDTAIHDLAYAVRKTGIEFHHLYVAGMPVQKEWNIDHPVDSYDVTDIATKVRREGSGREIPRYMIATPLGEADYGLTTSFVREQDAVKVKLLCYDTRYYKGLDSGFAYPDEVETDEDHPVVKVSGLVKNNDFPVS
jgi:lysine 2,3-aminomutase